MFTNGACILTIVSEDILIGAMECNKTDSGLTVTDDYISVIGFLATVVTVEPTPVPEGIA